MNAMQAVFVYPTVMLSLVAPLGALAETEYVVADVVASVPVIQVVEISRPVEQCREEEVIVEHRTRGEVSNTPVILGTIIGGALGNAVGHNKSNQRVGTVVGAVLGHSVGRDIIRSQSRGEVVREYETVERCDTVYERYDEERITGYRVTYRYNGQDYTVRTDTDPGATIRVRITVEPVL